MPIVQALDGVLTLYRERQGSQQHRSRARSKALPDQSAQDQPSGSELPHSAAQQAYEQSVPPRPRKPAVLAEDIMTSPVITIRPETSLSDAWAVMRGRSIHHLPIVSEAGFIVGILSDRDILRFSHTLGGQTPSKTHQASEIMTREVLSATGGTPIHEIARVMLNEEIGALPILDESNNPVGILTTSDILRALMNRAPLELWT